MNANFRVGIIYKYIWNMQNLLEIVTMKYYLFKWYSDIYIEMYLVGTVQCYAKNPVHKLHK